MLPQQTIWAIQGSEKTKPSSGRDLINRSAIPVVLQGVEDLANVIHDKTSVSLFTIEHKIKTKTIVKPNTTSSFEKQNFNLPTHIHMIDMERKDAFTHLTIKEGSSVDGEEHVINLSDYGLTVPDLPPEDPAKIVTWLRRTLGVQTSHAMVMSRSWSNIEGRKPGRFHVYLWFNTPMTSTQFKKGLQERLVKEQTYYLLTAKNVEQSTPFHPWVDISAGDARHSFEYNQSDDRDFHIPVVRDGKPLDTKKWLASAFKNQIKPVKQFTPEVTKRISELRKIPTPHRSKDTSHHVVQADLVRALKGAPVYETANLNTPVFDSFEDVPYNYKGNVVDPWEGHTDGRTFIANRKITNHSTGEYCFLPDHQEMWTPQPKEEDEKPYIQIFKGEDKLDISPFLDQLPNKLTLLNPPPKVGKTYQSLTNIPIGLLTPFPGGIIFIVPTYALVADIEKDPTYKKHKVKCMYAKDEAERSNREWDKAINTITSTGKYVMTHDKFMGEVHGSTIRLEDFLIIIDEYHYLLQGDGGSMQAKFERTDVPHKNRWFREFLHEATHLSILLMSATCLPEWVMIPHLVHLKTDFGMQATMYTTRVPDYSTIYGGVNSSLTIKESKPELNTLAQSVIDNGGNSAVVQAGLREDTSHEGTHIFSTSAGLAGVSYSQLFDGAVVHNDTSHNFGAMGVCQAALRIRSYCDYIVLKIAYDHFREEEVTVPPFDHLQYVARNKTRGVTKELLHLVDYFDTDDMMKRVIYIDADGHVEVDESGLIAFYLYRLEKAQKANFEMMRESVGEFGVDLVDLHSLDDDLTRTQVKEENEAALAATGLIRTSQNFKRFKEMVQASVTFDQVGWLITQDHIEDSNGPIRISKPEELLRSKLKTMMDENKAVKVLTIGTTHYDLTEEVQVQSITKPSVRQNLKRHQHAHALGYYEGLDKYMEEGQSYHNKNLVTKMNKAIPRHAPYTFKEDHILDHLKRVAKFDHDKVTNMTHIQMLRLFDDDLITVKKYRPQIT